MKEYAVYYVDWKGRKDVQYLYARSLGEAKSAAFVMQGLQTLLKVEENA